MKSLYLITFTLFSIVILSCKKDCVRTLQCTQSSDDYAYLNEYNLGALSLSTTVLSKQYQNVWKEILMEKNNLSESYFDKHIIPCNSTIDSVIDGMLFRICYKIQIDWAVAYSCDQFIIKIDKDNTLYPATYLPRDTFLTKEYIKTAIDAGVFSANLTKLSNKEVLQFASIKNAREQAINAANVNTLCSGDMFLDKTNGHLTLRAVAKEEGKHNVCVQGLVDLIDGNISVTDIKCRQ